MLRIHSSFHKCLTVYYIKVMERLYNWRPYGRRYEHLESIEGVFYNTVHKYKLVSVNGFAIDTSKLSGDFRIVRFVRDPRDLVVSGYHYHKRGAEPWFRSPGPTDKYWQPINAKVPEGMPRDISYSEYLNSLSLEQGLLAEIEFREFQLESLRQWPEDERIKLFKYENILGNESRVFGEIGDFYELPFVERRALRVLANRYSAKRQRGNRHIRNPEPGQWRQVFSDSIRRTFDRRYADILERLEY